MYVLTEEASDKRIQFLQFVFEENEGFVCIAQKVPNANIFNEQFFKWPEDVVDLRSYLDRSLSGNVYYCPMLFEGAQRSKETVVYCPGAWADLDGCHPSKMLVPASFEVETSPHRYQALWLFKEFISPADAEDISRRIAYFHRAEGADTSGWDLTQLLRMPFSTNFKYQMGNGIAEAPMVRIVKAKSYRYVVDSFNEYPTAEGSAYVAEPLPEELPGDSESILIKHRHNLHPHVWHLFSTKPKDDWSRSLWRLQMLLFECGLTKEEVFVVVRDAACNKYERDNRSESLLWKEVCRGAARLEERDRLIGPTERSLPALLSDEERLYCESNISIVEEFVDWAKTTGDAAWQYHRVGALTILSSLLSGAINLPTSFGNIIPNLWFMILADTTLTRKTTAMDLAMDILTEIDPDIVLATDGSIEGLLTSISMRPGRPSLFLRDEFSGLLEAMSKKEYMAGMAEMLTKMYDGKHQKRVLRKETIEVRDPILILFAGGIKDRVESLLGYELVASGFIPRFIMVSAESDVSLLRPLGPPTQQHIGKRTQLMQRFVDISQRFNQTQSITVNGRITTAKRKFDCSLTSDAWMRYNRFETDMLEAAVDSSQRDILTPCFDRLSKSGLKIAMLIAASNSKTEQIIIEEQDVIKAFYYIEQWRVHTLATVRVVGKGASERVIERITKQIEREPGVLRSTVMTRFHLTRRQADEIFETLDQRALIVRQRSGRGERLYPIGGKL